MASFLQRAFSLSLGDFKGGFRTQETVKIEKDPNDPTKDILRFGDGKDDYFPVKGDQKDKEALREILSKVIESPTQLKKIRDLPLENRPTLIQDHSGKLNGQPCAGYCSGDVISVSVSSGTGYAAAGTFCHEFQHQYQFKKGIGLHRYDLGLSESILNDRIYESAADTAKYQYMYEMKDKNLQARMAFETTKLDRPGLKAYAAAKNKGKSEQDCMLAGMMGYAESYTIAQCYAKFYHGEVGEEDRGLNGDLYTDNIRSAVGIRVFQSRMNGEKLDEVAAYKAHTVGMTTEKPVEQAVHKNLRSAAFNYVTPTIARALTRWAEKLKAAGKPMTENPDKLNVRTAYGITKNKERGGFAGMMFRAKTKLLSVVNEYKIGRDKASLGAKKSYRNGGCVVLALTADEKGLPAAQIGFSAKNGASKESEAVKKLGEKEVAKRTKTAQKMFGILMKQPAFKRQVDEMHKNGVEINLSFSDAVKEPHTIQGNTILLNPHQKPKQLADQFIRQFMPAVREGIAAKQAEPKTEAKTADPKAEVKQAEVKQAPKAAEPQQPEINGEVLLKMVNQLAFRASNAQKSDDYYKPTPLETKLIDSLAKYTKDMVKSAGIDYRSVQAKPFKAKCLAEWAKSPEGKSGVAKLLQAHGNMKAFEKPREKTPLMQSLQAKTAEQTQSAAKQTFISKMQNNQR